MISDAVLVGIISAVVSLIGITVTARTTRDSVTNKLDTNQQVMNTEINHIKDTMTDMKDDIKAHNGYAKMFSESVPVIKEQIKAIDKRMDNLENKIK